MKKIMVCLLLAGVLFLATGSSIAPNSTGVITYFHLSDSSTGADQTGLTYESAGLAFAYIRVGEAAVSVSPQEQTVTGQHINGGFAEVDETKCPGLYRIDWPDAAFVSGVNNVTLFVQATGCFSVSKSYDVANIDITSSLNAIDVNEPASSDPNTWTYRHALLWPFWHGTNRYVMSIPDSNQPGQGTLTIYKRDGVTPLAVQDVNETTSVHTRDSIWQ